MLNDVLAIWLQDLQACAINLVEYGRKEKATHDQFPMATHYMYREVDSDKQKYAHGTWHFIDFDFGPSPSDWRIKVAKCATIRCIFKHFLWFPTSWPLSLLSGGTAAESGQLIPGGWMD